MRSHVFEENESFVYYRESHSTIRKEDMSELLHEVERLTYSFIGRNSLLHLTARLLLSRVKLKAIFYPFSSCALQRYCVSLTQMSFCFMK